MMLEGWLLFQNDLLEQLPLILIGLLKTVQLAVIVTITGILGGIFILYLKVSQNKLISRIAHGYISFFIGTPLIVLLFIMYYGLPQYGMRLSPFIVAVIGFTMNVSAYNASYLFIAYKGLDHTELEAAKAQGFSFFQIYRFIALPQIFRTSIPALTNQVINNLKDSSYAFLIGYTDVFARIQELASTNFHFFYAYLFAALVYLLMVSFIVIGARLLEKKVVFR